MILEVATLDVKPGESEAFKAAFAQAQVIISSMPGYISHQLQHCLERPDRYLLLVSWEALEHHTVGFRESAQYQQWRELLHHFYEPFPEVAEDCPRTAIAIYLFIPKACNAKARATAPQWKVLCQSSFKVSLLATFIVGCIVLVVEIDPEES